MSEPKRFSMVVYDGVNFFRDGNWTGLEFPTVEEGRHVIGFLETLTNEQVDHWIRVQQYLKSSNKTFNALKYSTKYSGETTAHAPIHTKDGWKDTPNAGPDCIQAVNLFDVQWSNCPKEVEKEVSRLWSDAQLSNDVCIYKWNGAESDGTEYPIIETYLKSRGITECLIHWWW